jgi:hypothetical protein
MPRQPGRGHGVAAPREIVRVGRGTVGGKGLRHCIRSFTLKGFSGRERLISWGRGIRAGSPEGGGARA